MHSPEAKPSSAKLPIVLTPFVLIAVLATLSAGTLLGAINLVRIQYLFASVTPEVKRLHAAFQIFGLMGAFICGVALQVVPRFWQAVPPGRRFVKTIAGLLATTLSLRMLSVGVSAVWPGAIATLLLLAAGATGCLVSSLFAAWIVRCWRGNPRPSTGIGAILVLGALIWPLGSLLWLLGELPWGDGVLLTWGVYAAEELLLWGFLLSWFLGMAPHVTPYFPRLSPPEARAPWAIVTLVAAGSLLRAAGALSGDTGLLSDLGLLILAAACLVFVGGSVRPSRPLAVLPPPVDRAARLSIGWLGIAAVTLGAAAIRSLTGAGGTHQLVIDAARHAAVVGFFLGMLVVVSSRIVPVFSGKPLRHPKALIAGLVLFHAGVAARWAQAGAALIWPALLPVSGWSGALVMIGLVPWIANLMHCLEMAPCQALASRRVGPACCGGCSGEAA